MMPAALRRKSIWLQAVAVRRVFRLVTITALIVVGGTAGTWARINKPVGNNSHGTWPQFMDSPSSS